MRTLDRIFKLSRIFKACPEFIKHLRYTEYGENAPEWDGYYEFAGRCIAFKEHTGGIVWLHEVR